MYVMLLRHIDLKPITAYSACLVRPAREPLRRRACALVAPGGALRVQWRAMLRDVLVWGATIVITAGCLANGKVSALEGWLMVAFYALYVVICAYWSRIISRFAPPPRVVRKAAEPAAKPGEIIYVLVCA